MSYKATWLDKLEQFGSINIDLLIVDDEGIRPNSRVTKSYDLSKYTVDAAFLASEAQNFIDQTVADQDAQQ